MEFSRELLLFCVDFGQFGVGVHFWLFNFVFELRFFDKFWALFLELFDGIGVAQLLAEHEHCALAEKGYFFADDEERVEDFVTDVLLDWGLLFGVLKTVGVELDELRLADLDALDQTLQYVIDLVICNLRVGNSLAEPSGPASRSFGTAGSVTRSLLSLKSFAAGPGWIPGAPSLCPQSLDWERPYLRRKGTLLFDFAFTLDQYNKFN